MPFLPDAAVLLAYSLACLVLFITPGPDMSLFLAKTVAGGRAAGIAAFDRHLARLRRAFAARGIRPLGADRRLADAVPRAQDRRRALSALARHRRRAQRLLAQRRAEHHAGACLLADAGAAADRQPRPTPRWSVLRDVPAAVRRCRRSARGGQAVVPRHLFRGRDLPAGRADDPRRRARGDGLKSRPRVLRAIDWLFAGVFSAFAVRILTTQGR